jgi:hypothetical protein
MAFFFRAELAYASSEKFPKSMFAPEIRPPTDPLIVSSPLRLPMAA